MKYVRLFILLLVAACQPCDKPISESYSEQYRPQFHYTPPAGWMNDPNGMVYFDGEYHLFYQYYPHSMVWGPMHWGHAVSTDLVKWENLPIALYPDHNGQIFSGSAVIDWNNTSGLQKGDNPPIVAIFTYHDMLGEKEGRKDFQTQGIAVSSDKGRTWEVYKDNPVLDNEGIKDFRDPKVMWHEASQKWIMSLAVGNQIYFYGSPNLIDWSFLGTFGTDGQKGGVWECPDLFELKVEGTNESKWVLLVSLNPGGPNGGSATQYFIGDFNGTTFVNENEKDLTLWLDYGRDNYAGVTWSDVPKEDGRRLFIGWMSNWDYARMLPTDPWRSAMTIPRELSLIETARGIRLSSSPVEELNTLRGTENKADTITVNGLLNISKDFKIRANGFEGEFEIEWSEDLPYAGLRLSNSKGEYYQVGYNSRSTMLTSDRTRSGNRDIAESFAGGIHVAPRDAENDRKSIKIWVFVDATSIELFADDGRLLLTDLFFPTEDFDKIELFSFGGSSVFRDIKFYNLNSIWE